MGVYGLVIEDFIVKLTAHPKCGEAVREILRKTAHLVKAKSVAYAAGFCVFAARLAEAMGAIPDLSSTLPGKGTFIHQILALALPKLYYDERFRESFINGRLSSGTIRYAVEHSFEELIRYGVVDKEFANKRKRETIENSCKMIHNLARVLPLLIRELGMNKDSIRLYTELPLYSYRFHVIGVIDAIIEDPIRKRAIVVEWKTEKTPSQWELAQAYVYALLEAERLGLDDPIKAVRDDELIIPIVVRPGGDIPIYSVASIMKTTKREFDRIDMINKILLAAEHLTLIVTTPEKFIDRTTIELCKITGASGRIASAFRRVPEGLPRYNPHKHEKYPCGICIYRDACIFYIMSFEESTELDKYAWRARFAIYNVRENALKPLKELNDLAQVRVSEAGETDRKIFESIDKVEKKLHESGNRVDYFEFAEISVDDYTVYLKRPLSREEVVEGPANITTVREGKPVLVIFRDNYIINPLLRLSFHGRVDNIDIIEHNGHDYVVVAVSAPNMPSRLSLLILDTIAKYDKLFLEKPMAVEINVDLTQLELQAIDAYHRATKEILKRMISKDLMTKISSRINKDRKERVDFMLAYLFAGKALEGE